MCHHMTFGTPATFPTALAVLIYVLNVLWSYGAVASPRCEQPPAFKEITELTPAGTLIGTVATGADLSWAYDFSLNDPPLHGMREYFDFSPSPDGNSYQFTNVKVVDIEELYRKRIHFFGVGLVRLTCRDRRINNVPVKFIVHLYVEQVNEFDPAFNVSRISISVQENTPICTEVVKLAKWASDKDINLRTVRDIHLFRMSGGSAFQFFRLENPSDGTVVVGTDLNFEAMQHSTVTTTVTVQDHGGRKATAELAITITDMDDQPPVFYYAGCSGPCQVVYRGDIAEMFTGAVTNIEPAPIKAKDGDSLGYDIRYYLEGRGAPFHQYLSMDKTTGVITVKRPLFDFPGTHIVLSVIAEEVSQAKYRTATSLYLFVNRDMIPENSVACGSLGGFPVFSLFTARVALAFAMIIISLFLILFILFRGKTPVAGRGQRFAGSEESRVNTAAAETATVLSDSK